MDHSFKNSQQNNKSNECRIILRQLEIEAYSSVISAFRAQGDLTDEKSKILQSLAKIFAITRERHKAEVRRAVNSEDLSAVAECLFGTNTVSHWLMEGRNLIPIIPRAIPQTAYTILADKIIEINTKSTSSQTDNKN